MALDMWRINLKILRNRLDKNQSYIALKLGKTQQTIGNWESGIGEPNISELITITKLFGISVDNFIKVKQIKTDLSSSKNDTNMLHEEQADYATASNMMQTLSLAVRGLDAANILLQTKVTALEEENTRLKKRKTR
ncbi:MAG TPA: helix-turn-helix transcriptional regulator [Ferruginibacter sp.]|nr:helix-turn-helix transcriptional regulator [Ferruginibacter sp.]